MAASPALAAARSRTPACPAGITLRDLETRHDYEQCVALQRDTWGDDYAEIVPPVMLMMGRRMGGVAAGAFDADGRLLGFIFGITGLWGGDLAHWSNKLAVRHESQGLGLARLLKGHQRARLLEVGVERAYWSYDPLVARNAHLNLNRLGARAVEYVVDMYGETGSPLHRAIGTDRFIVEWPLTDPRVEEALAVGLTAAPRDWADAPVVNGTVEPGAAGDGPVDVPAAKAVRVEIPDDVYRLIAESPESAAEWRRGTRRAFLDSMARGYRVQGFGRDVASGRGTYLLTR